MFKVVGKRCGTYGILDTEDNVTEYLSIEDIIKTLKLGFKIQGIEPILERYKKLKNYDFEEIAKYAYRLLKEADSGFYDKSIENEKDCVIVSLRDWGSWHNPIDAEDEEDYDWQDLDPQYYDKLHEIVKAIRKKYPDVEVHSDVGEKNWVSIVISKY